MQPNKQRMTWGRPYPISWAALALASALAGCGAQAGGDADPQALGGEQSVEQPLMRYNNVALWPNGQVPICFNGRGTSREAGWVKTALAHAWSAVANIDFQYSNTCPFPGATNYIRISWTAASGWGIGGWCQPGMRSPTEANFGYCSAGDCNAAEYEEAFKSVAVHEIGHGLGFAHEHQRDDRLPPAGCLPAEPQRANYATDAEYQSAHADWVTNIAVISDGIKLSSPYDSDSIMNYCRGVSSTTGPLPYQLEYRAADRLSVGDLYGTQQAYGNRIAYWLLSPTL